MRPVLERDYNFQLKIKDFFAIVVSDTTDTDFFIRNKIDTKNNTIGFCY